MNRLRKFLRKSLGLEVRRLGPAVDPHLRLVQMLEQRNVAEVLDIGANIGQFAQDLREAG